MLAASALGSKMTLLSTPVTIEVTNPKTKDAFIDFNNNGVTYYFDKQTKSSEAFDFIDLRKFFEYMNTADGELLVVRIDNSEFIWQENKDEQGNPGPSHSAKYNIVYFPAEPFDDGSGAMVQHACDARQWQKIRPLGYAPYDKLVNGEDTPNDHSDGYGFAKQPFRDTQGDYIRPEEVTDPSHPNYGKTQSAPFALPGTYPWMDSLGDNIGFLTFGSGVHDEYNESTSGGDDVNVRCLEETPGSGSRPDEGEGIACPSLRADAPPLLGAVLMGSWTNGKMVLMDNLVNNTDWDTVGLPRNAHREVNLYQDENGNDYYVRVGHGEEQLNQRTSERDFVTYPVPIGSPRDSAFFESFENKLNYRKELLPVTPRDVVWHVSKGWATGEFAFDDHMMPDAFIISDMTQTIKVDFQNSGGHQIQAFNGREHTKEGGRIHGYHLQNGSSSTKWQVPSYGQISNNGEFKNNGEPQLGSGGDQDNDGILYESYARIEPIAQGGVHGKGLWLSGDEAKPAYIEYNVPQQNKASTVVAENDWHISLFVDPRLGGDVDSSGDAEPISAERVLVAFPDDTEIRLVGLNTVRYVYSGGSYDVTLPDSALNDGWRHLGVQYQPSSQSMTLYYNGFAVDKWTTPSPVFQMNAGSLYVGYKPGGSASAFRGWIDEFKVIARESSVEEWCNHANGTLIGLPGSGSQQIQDWLTIANEYPAWAHQDLTDLLSFIKGNSQAYPHRGSQATYARYACYADYTEDYKASKANIPSGAEGLRDVILFPEGPLFWDAPRPDTTNNAFCTSCHTDDKDGDGIPALLDDNEMYNPGLAMIALMQKMNPNTGDLYNAKDDVRRQPFQTNSGAMFGNIPKDYFGAGAPATDAIYDLASGGLSIDQFLLPTLGGTNPPSNQTPIANAGGAQTVEQGDNVSLNGSASADPDGSITGYSWQQVAGQTVSLNGAITAVASFVAPSVELETELTFELTVIDNDGASNTTQVTILVSSNTNVAPVANAGSDQTVDIGDTVSLDGSASADSDGSITGYSWQQVAGQTVSLNGATTLVASFVAPSVAVSTELTFELTVTDNDGDSNIAQVTILVSPNTNVAPSASAGNDQTVDIGDAVSLDGSASADPDGSITDYSWQQVSGQPVSLTDATTAVASFVAPSVAVATQLTFELTVTDNDGLSNTDVIVVSVNPLSECLESPAPDGLPAIIDTSTVQVIDKSQTSLTIQWQHDSLTDTHDIRWRTNSGPGAWVEGQDLNNDCDESTDYYTITGLAPETQYKIRIRAKNASGRNSSWSSILVSTALTTLP